MPFLTPNLPDNLLPTLVTSKLNLALVSVILP